MQNLSNTPYLTQRDRYLLNKYASAYADQHETFSPDETERLIDDLLNAMEPHESN
jgi:hypothetical protein